MIADPHGAMLIPCPNIGVKVGDRVRATCGGSVIVGEVKHLYPSGVDVRVDGEDIDDDLRWFAFPTWTFEVLAPPIPDVVGTIVRDSDGDAWRRSDDGWYYTSEEGGGKLEWVQRHYGPLTVLWTPKATP